jgi:hypothetical protein
MEKDFEFPTNYWVKIINYREKQNLKTPIKKMFLLINIVYKSGTLMNKPNAEV